ncbi:hypothetical protein H7097_03245 [Aeromicrobium sp.]|nr:hypothetical protein [Candidatus Saccharibacteria bacterium]
MSTKRVYYIMIGLVAVLFIGVIGGTYQVNSLLKSKAKHLVDLKLQSQVIASQQTGLQNAKKQVAQYAGFEATAKAIVPQDKDQAQAVLEITKLAAASGITRLSSVTFPLSTLGGVAGAGASTPPSGAAPSTASPKTSLTQLLPVKGGSAGLYSLQITIQQTSEATIPYSQFITFLEKLEQNRRTAQVSSIVLQPDNLRPNMVAFTLVINEFIKP